MLHVQSVVAEQVTASAAKLAEDFLQLRREAADAQMMKVEKPLMLVAL